MNNYRLFIYASVLLLDQTNTVTCDGPMSLTQSFSFSFRNSTDFLDYPIIGRPGYPIGGNLKIGTIVTIDGDNAINNTLSLYPYYLSGIGPDGSCTTTADPRDISSVLDSSLINTY